MSCNRNKSEVKNNNFFSNWKLPHEILYQVFTFLDLPALIAVTEVCNSWRVASFEKQLWVPKFIGDSIAVTLARPAEFKIAALNLAIEKLVKRVSALRRQVDAISGTVGNHISFVEKVKPTFIFKFIDVKGNVDAMAQADDSFLFKSTLHCRCYSNLCLNFESNIKKVQLLASIPLFAGRKWPCFKTVVATEDINLDSRAIVASDELITLFKITCNFYLAFWNGGFNDVSFKGDNIAFVIGTIPAHKFVERCLQPNKSSILARPLKPLNVDYSALTAELSRFSCFVELRNSRESFWTEKSNPIAQQDGKSAILIVKSRDSPNSSWTIPKDSLCFLWKTELFKGKIQKMCFVDFVLLDTDNKPVYISSSLAKFEEIDSKSYDYSEGKMFRLVTSNKFCEILIELFSDDTDRRTFIRHFQVRIFDVNSVYEGPNYDAEAFAKKSVQHQMLNDELQSYKDVSAKSSKTSRGSTNTSKPQPKVKTSGKSAKPPPDEEQW